MLSFISINYRKPVGLVHRASHPLIFPFYSLFRAAHSSRRVRLPALTTSAVTSGQPISILTYFQNTGNIHFKVEGEVTVKDAQGQTLDKISIPLSASSILPGATRQLTATLPSTSALATGYTIDSKVTLQDGTVLDETTSTFPITTQYVPPTTTPSNTPTTTKTQNVPTTASTFTPQEWAG